MRVFRFIPPDRAFQSQPLFPRLGRSSIFFLLIQILVFTVGVVLPAMADTNALTMVSAVSRKVHGTAGTFDLPLNIGPANSATVEPRTGGPTTFLFTFSDNITTVDGTLGSTNFTITNATFSDASIASNTLTLNLTAIPDTSLVLVTLNGITDLANNPLTGTDNVAVRALYGDVSQSGTVNVMDMQMVKNQLLQAVTPANFLCDVNCNGSINVMDLQPVKNCLLHTLTSHPVVMTLVLDRSGSMMADGGASALPAAVGNFISFFDDSTDRVAQVSFATVGSVDVPMQQPFKSAVTNAASSLSFGGATYVDGALQLAVAQNQSVSLPASPGAVKALVFFTDGYPNIFQFTWTNSVYQVKTCDVGGFDASSNTYGLFNATNSAQITPPHSSGFFSGPVPVSGAPYDMPTSTFVSIDGTTKNITGSNFCVEAQLRAVVTADTVRSQTNFIYCVCLPYGGSDPAQTAFLQIIANDPALLVNTNLPAPFITSQHTNLASYYNPAQPAGEAVVAPTAADLKQMLQLIVARILAQ